MEFNPRGTLLLGKLLYQLRKTKWNLRKNKQADLQKLQTGAKD